MKDIECAVIEYLDDDLFEPADVYSAVVHASEWEPDRCAEITWLLVDKWLQERAVAVGLYRTLHGVTELSPDDERRAELVDRIVQMKGGSWIVPRLGEWPVMEFVAPR